MKFIKIAQTDKNSYLVLTKKDDILLGEIEYYDQWHKFIFTPERHTFYDCECMIELGEYLKLCKLQG